MKEYWKHPFKINLFFLTLLIAIGFIAVVQAGAQGKSAQPHMSVCPGPAEKGTARCHAQVIVDRQGLPKTSTLPIGYGSAQFHSAYGLPTLGPTNQTIAIVDAYDDRTIKSDLDRYDSVFGLPPFPSCPSSSPCFQKIDQRGGKNYPQGNAGWSLEIALDVETAHEMCQNCKILLVEADSNSFTNLMAAVDQAAAQGANAISNSYGASEFSGETSYDPHLNHSGIAITFSSGDGGYGVEYPAASQYVTAVGGTTLYLNSDNTRNNEVIWNGAGSGCSSYEIKPSWQTDSGCSRRTVADVSADADPNTGAAVYDSVKYYGRSGWFQVGGTSLGSPLIASIYALAGNASSLGNAGSYPYSHAGSLFDIISGSNGSCGSFYPYLCTAETGFDGPSGLGTPNGTGAF